MRRQLLYFGIFAAAVFIIIGGSVWYFWPDPTCSDGKKNGGEEGIDCGGSCATPCLEKIKDIGVEWKRFFKIREGFYDVAALINNQNFFAGLESIKYQFKLYDANNILIANRDGETFVNAGERQVIFESNIQTGFRIPRYVYVEFENKKNWKYVSKEKTFLSVVKKDFVNFPFPRVSAEIRNESVSETKNVLVTAIIYDSEGNIQGVSFTKIDVISPESSKSSFFTWPVPFEKEPAAIEIFATTDLTK